MEILQKLTGVDLSFSQLYTAAILAIWIGDFVGLLAGWTVLVAGFNTAVACALVCIIAFIGQVTEAQEKLVVSAKNCTCFDGMNG